MHNTCLSFVHTVTHNIYDILEIGTNICFKLIRKITTFFNNQELLTTKLSTLNSHNILNVKLVSLREELLKNHKQAQNLMGELSQKEESEIIDHLNTLSEIIQPRVKHLSNTQFPQQVAQVQSNKEILKKIKTMNVDDDFSIFEQKLKDCSSDLVRLIQFKTKQILEGKLSKEEYKKLHHQFRNLFLYELIQKKILTPSSSNEEFILTYTSYLKGENEIVLNAFSNQELIKAFMMYRRCGCTRFSAEKVKNYFYQKGTLWTRLAVMVTPVSYQLMDLTWLHGTSAIPLTHKTDFKFIPTGWLKQCNIIPMTGELGRGSVVLELKKQSPLEGVNKDGLSGTLLEESLASENYANNYQFSLQKEIDRIVKFITFCRDNKSVCFQINNIQSLKTFLPDLSSFEYSTYKIICWNKILFKKYENDFVTTLETIKKCCEEVENSLDQLNKQHRDLVNTIKCYIEKILKNYHSIQEMTEEEKSILQDCFPALVASRTINVMKVNNLEVLSLGDAKLGRDLQEIFVKKSDFSKAESFLKKHQLDKCVHIHTFKDLEISRLLFKEVQPYIFDVLSLKKLKKL